ncbi:hypothetical protein [Sphingomonas sp. PP-CC-3A-396]|uniref:hypothetical protein n=1 Tax=Sphingomonas sp. PP-CC-3A-396 TaxID=2135655 RepID=UPI0010438193|nr:hypothetical protein [Sphingomonas sp. PP-CC-3A-396]
MNEHGTEADANISVLLRLHDEIDEASDAMTAQAIASSFKPPMLLGRVEAALAHLLLRGWVVSTKRFPMEAYKISRNGILEVEKTHDISMTIDPGTNLIMRNYSARVPNTITSHFDWTKWGTIFGAVGVAVSILIAVFS